MGIKGLEADTRRLLLTDASRDLRFIFLKPADIPTYVEYGAADLGIVGKDILAEQQPDVYEPVDLGFGFCRLVVAEPRDLWERDDPTKWSWVRVATKYPTLTERYFSERGIQVEMIHLDGSIELAPLVGLAERIVDLVQSGRDAPGQRPGRGRRDHDVDGASDRQPRIAQDRPCPRQRPHRGHAAGGDHVIRRLDTAALGAARSGAGRSTARPAAVDPEIHRRVEEIVAAVRDKGDAALLDFTERFDRVVAHRDGARGDAGRARRGGAVGRRRHHAGAPLRGGADRALPPRVGAALLAHDRRHGLAARPGSPAARPRRRVRPGRARGLPVHRADDGDPGARRRREGDRAGLASVGRQVPERRWCWPPPAWRG